MKYKKITARFTADDIDLAEELICDVFFSANLKGVVCEIPIEEPDEGFGTATLPQPDHTAIIGYLPDTSQAEKTLARVQRRLTQLDQFKIQIRIYIDTVDEETWAHAWKAFFDVTRITDRLVIKPAWQPFTPGPDDRVILLDPGMAFGTGTHPSTAMCLKLIEKFLPRAARFLDVGCGSGILMIAASLLGAAWMTGIDTDETAIQVTQKNLTKNQIDPGHYDLFCAPLAQVTASPYHLIAANIIAQVIVEILPDIKQRLAPKGIAILSGIIQERETEVMTALEQNRLTTVQRITEAEWVTLAIQADH